MRRGTASCTTILLMFIAIGVPFHVAAQGDGRTGAPSTTGRSPAADHHQHLPSAAATRLLNQTRPGSPPLPAPTVEQLIAQLDEAGVQRAVLLSTAYWFASELMPRADGDERTNVQAENDWTAAQASRFVDRLVAFCSVNPLRQYALEEIARCARNRFVRGLKLHNGNSGVDLLNVDHVERLRAAFRAANDSRMAIVVHLWSGESYGRRHAEIFLQQVLPAAPDVVVQIAHFAGGGPGYTDAALGVYAEAIAVGNPATSHLYFDVAGVANFQPPQVLTRFASRIRELGVQRVLFGTDVGTPRQNWRIFRDTVPLSDTEFEGVARNTAPYLN